MPTEEELARTATATEAEDPRQSLPPAPDRLGKYRIEGTLGAGGMGVVHVAFDTDLERRIALKLLLDAPGDVSRARLLREARSLARLSSHPHVVAVYDAGTIDGRDFVAMELIDGQSVADWLRATPRSKHDILDVFVAAGNGLAAAHAEGLVHRDFKPHNVLRSKKGRVVVTDFGLARGVDTHLPITRPVVGMLAHGTPSFPMLTATGAVVGTPAYMAPEQWTGDAIGPATDQFAFAVALWEALAGERPFKGDTGEELRAAVERGPQVLDASRVPRRFRALLLRALSPQPARRWASMDAMLAAIARARRRPVLAIGAGVALLGVAAVIVAIGLRGGGDAATPVAAVQPAGEPAVVVAPVPLGDHDQLVASITSTMDGIELPRATYDQIVANFDKLFGKDGRLVPSMTSSEPSGFKLYAIQPRSIYAAFGLQNGDLIVSIDNVAIAASTIEELRRHAAGKTHHVIDFQRKRIATRLSVDVK